MSAFSSQAVQQRLFAIMEALSRAAVAEICELVDGSYARLYVELERTQRENEDLRKKLHVIESIVVRGGNGGGEKGAEPEERAPGSVAESGLKEPQQQPTEDRRDAAARVGGAAEEPEVPVVHREEVNRWNPVMIIIDLSLKSFNSVIILESRLFVNWFVPW